MSKWSKMSKLEKGLTAAFYTAAFGIVGVIGYGLSDQQGAEKAINDDGRFTVTSYEGHKVLGCGKGDLYRDEFKAVNKDGKPVDIVVCKGIFKGSTVRTLD